MFGKKKKTEVEEVKTEKYKCPFQTGDKITITYADLADFPIGTIGRKDSCGWFFIIWDCGEKQGYKYCLPSEIPGTSNRETQWKNYTLVSDFINENTKKDGYLITKVTPVNSVVADGEADIYYAALFDFTIKEWNTPYVLVKNRRDNGVPNLEICKIEEIISREEYPHKVQAEIICAVNVEDYLHRESVRKENSKLYTTLIREHNIEPKQLKALELEEICNPLLKKFKENLKYTF